MNTSNYHVDNTIHWRNFSPVFNTIGFTNTPLAFINRKYKFISFYGNSITSFLGRTFSGKNVHFNHLSFHFRNYHANASSVTPSECHFLYCKVYYVFRKTLTSITLSFIFFESTLCFILIHKHIPADESGQRSSR